MSARKGETMENASKALMMAAVILIGVLLLALMVYFFSSAYGLRSSYSDNINNTRITEFNTKFTKYNITETQYENSNCRDYVTIHNIVTLANYASEFNEGLTGDDNEYIRIVINEDGIGNISKNKAGDNNKLLKDYNDAGYKFVSTEVQYDTTGRIKLMQFELISEPED